MVRRIVGARVGATRRPTTWCRRRWCGCWPPGPDRAGDARAVRHRHGPQRHRDDVAGGGPAPAQPAPGRRSACPSEARTCSPTRSRPPSPRPSTAWTTGAADPAGARGGGAGHQLAGRGLGSTAGAVAAQLNRTRARLRVEYLLALEQTEPPTDRCRPVLLALSGGDRRRQREVDAARHLLDCDLCARLSEPLTGRGQQPRRRRPHPDQPRRRHRRCPSGGPRAGGQGGFAGTDLTLLATAVSEVARNIVRFAEGGEIVVELVERAAARACSGGP